MAGSWARFCLVALILFRSSRDDCSTDSWFLSGAFESPPLSAPASTVGVTATTTPRSIWKIHHHDPFVQFQTWVLGGLLATFHSGLSCEGRCRGLACEWLQISRLSVPFTMMGGISEIGGEHHPQRANGLPTRRFLAMLYSPVRPDQKSPLRPPRSTLSLWLS